MKKNIKLSLCMIVKDEEATLGKCLDSIKDIVDEIIIVDTGSTDRTKEIAKTFGAKIINFKWQDDFALARNFAFSQATGQYIMWLDGDDFIPDDSKDELKNIVAHLDGTLDYISGEYVLVRNANGDRGFSMRRNRIVKREKNFKWIGKVHEFLEVYGNGMAGDFEVEHGKVKVHTDRNLHIFQQMEEKQIDFSPRDLYYYANELKDHAQYEKAIQKYREFIATKQGWIEDIKGSYVNMIKCYKQLGKTELVVPTALESFNYDIPRSDVCCHLGEHYMTQQLYKQAAFWYRTAFECAPEPGSLGMEHSGYYTWVPSIQLCICYFQLGKLDCSYFFNELAATFDPTSDKVAYNRKFFSDEYARRGLPIPKIQEVIKMRDYINYL